MKLLDIFSFSTLTDQALVKFLMLLHQQTPGVKQGMIACVAHQANQYALVRLFYHY